MENGEWRDAARCRSHHSGIPGALTENPLNGLQSLDFRARLGYNEHVPDKATLRR